MGIRETPGDDRGGAALQPRDAADAPSPPDLSAGHRVAARLRPLRGVGGSALAEPHAADGLTGLRERAAAQLEREAAWLRELTADYAGRVDAADRTGGTARLATGRDRERGLQRLRIAIRNCQTRLRAAERAAAAAQAPHVRFIRAVLALRHAIFDAVEVASAGRLRA